MAIDCPGEFNIQSLIYPLKRSFLLSPLRHVEKGALAYIHANQCTDNVSSLRVIYTAITIRVAFKSFIKKYGISLPHIWMHLIWFDILLRKQCVRWSCKHEVCGFSYSWMLRDLRDNWSIFQRSCWGQHGTHIIWYPGNEVKLLRVEEHQSESEFRCTVQTICVYAVTKFQFDHSFD